MAINEIWVDAPGAGVELGKGYDYANGVLKSSIGIDFEPSAKSAQEKEYKLTEVSDQYSLMTAFDLSVEAQYKAVIFEVKGKAKFCTEEKINGLFKSFGAHAKVFDRQFTQTVKRPSHGGKGIFLTEDALDLLNSDANEFYDTYGEYFIVAIEEGAELDIALTFETTDVKKQTQIEAELSGSYKGFEASLASTIKTASENTKTATVIHYHQTGGSGDPMPLGINEFENKIRDLPQLAEKKPMIYKIQLQCYDSLPNWPKGKTLKKLETNAREIKTRRYFEYKTLYNDIGYILANKEKFGFGRGTNEKILEHIKDELGNGMAAIEVEFENYDPIIPNGMPSAAIKSDYEFRVFMPLPIESRYEFNKIEEKDLKEKILEMYIKKIANVRCQRSPRDPGCLSEDKKKQYLEMIPAVDVHWKNIGHANDLVGLTALDGKLYCATKDNKLYVRDPVHWDTNWTWIGHANDLVGLAGLDGKLYCATKDNKLYVRDPVHRDANWTWIGHANDLVGLTGLDGKLYCATKDNKLYVREPVHRNANWTWIGHANDLVGLTGLDGKLYCATRDRKLFVRKPDHNDIPWEHIYETDQVVVGLTGLDGKLYCATSDNQLKVSNIN